MLCAIVTHRWLGALNKVNRWPDSSDHEVKMGAFFALQWGYSSLSLCPKWRNTVAPKGLYVALKCVKHWWVGTLCTSIQPFYGLITHDALYYVRKWFKEFANKNTWPKAQGTFDYFHSQSILSPVRKVGGYNSLVSTPAPIKCSFTDEIFTCNITTHN